MPFDFAMILTPATLAGAPHTQIAAVYAPESAEAAIERAVADRFANVTAIRTREALAAVNGLLDRIAWGVRGAAAVTLVAGALVLAGAIAADRRRRTFETVVFKVLGATRTRIAGTYLVEYGVLGLVTATIAAGLGIAVGWAVSVDVMDFAWAVRWDVVAATVVVCVALTLVDRLRRHLADPRAQGRALPAQRIAVQEPVKHRPRSVKIGLAADRKGDRSGDEAELVSVLMERQCRVAVAVRAERDPRSQHDLDKTPSAAFLFDHRRGRIVCIGAHDRRQPPRTGAGTRACGSPTARLPAIPPG